MNIKKAYLAGQRLGLRKRAELSGFDAPELGMLGGGALGAGLGAATTKKDKKTGRRSKLKMLLRAIIGGGAGALAGGAIPGAVFSAMDSDNPDNPGMLRGALHSLGMGARGIEKDVGALGELIGDKAGKGADRAVATIRSLLGNARKGYGMADQVGMID
jgi:hypothetical protein